MLRDAAGDSLLSARTRGVASFNLSSRKNVRCLAKERRCDGIQKERREHERSNSAQEGCEATKHRRKLADNGQAGSNPNVRFADEPSRIVGSDATRCAGHNYTPIAVTSGAKLGPYEIQSLRALAACEKSTVTDSFASPRGFLQCTQWGEGRVFWGFAAGVLNALGE
jgi:hypothetical protein